MRRDGLTLYTRRYPFGPLFAHAVGYNTVGDGRTALELAENPYLTASNSNLATVISNLGSTLRGETVTGDNVVTSLSVPAQRAAQKGLARPDRGGRGDRAEHRPGGGDVLLAELQPDQGRAELPPPEHAARRAAPEPRHPGPVRAGLDVQDRDRHERARRRHARRSQLTIDAGGHCITVEAHPLCNAGTESFGTIPLSTAITNSVNTYFAQLGQKLGQTRLEATMQKFGFFQLPPFTYPTDEMNPSGLYANGRLIGPNAPIDVGRVAIGQERLAVTPLQMAEVAATVANGGVRMAPTPGGQGRHPVRRTRSTRASRRRSSG